MIFRLADRSDDAQLRKLTREMVMPGHIRMIYAREPDFFLACEIADDDTQVMVAEQNGEIVGVGCRSIRTLWVDGAPAPFGYLAGLRLGPSVQNTTALARGYAFLSELHQAAPVPAYLTTIIEGNEKARRMLTSGRGGLPTYTPLGQYVTYVMPVKRRPSHFACQTGRQIVVGSELSDDELTSFLMDAGARRQFFPVCGGNGRSSRLIESIGHENVLVARREGRILGTLTVWDQKDHKQNIVAGYSGMMGVARPVLNLLLRARGLHPLPAGGHELRYGTAAMVCIRDDDPRVLEALLRRALDHASERGMQWLAVGLHERDPLAAAMSRFLKVVYRSHVYLVSWDEDAPLNVMSKSLVPYLELGTL